MVKDIPGDYCNLTDIICFTDISLTNQLADKQLADKPTR